MCSGRVKVLHQHLNNDVENFSKILSDCCWYLTRRWWWPFSRSAVQPFSWFVGLLVSMNLWRGWVWSRTDIIDPDPNKGTDPGTFREKSTCWWGTFVNPGVLRSSTCRTSDLIRFQWAVKLFESVCSINMILTRSSVWPWFWSNMLRKAIFISARLQKNQTLFTFWENISFLW